MPTCEHINDCPLLQFAQQETREIRRYGEETREMVERNRVEARENDRELFGRLDRLQTWMMTTAGTALVTLVVAILMFAIGKH